MEVSDERLYDLFITRQLLISQMMKELKMTESALCDRLKKAGLIELRKNARRPKI